MSSATVRRAWGELEARWAANGVDLAVRLGPGVGADEVADALSVIGLPVPSEVAAWFDSQGGVGGSCTAVGRTVGAGLVALRLDDVAEVHARTLNTIAQLSALLDLDAEPAELWNPSWLPIALTPDGVFGVECVAGQAESAVWSYAYGPAVATTVAASLAELVDGWVALIDDGWWVWSDVDGFWHDRPGAPAELARYVKV